MSEFILNINGERKRVKVDGEMPLLWVLRDTLGYTGTNLVVAVASAVRARFI